MMGSEGGCAAGGTEREGLVKGISGEFAVVEVEAMPSACGKCGESGGCGKPQAGPRRYAVPNTIGARVGDRVILSVPQGVVLRAAVLSYLMPLVFVIGGAAAAMAAFGDGAPTVAGAALGLAFGLIILRILNMRMARSRSWLRLALKH
jgi:sigma-E factor negative regulatory protein RseC